MKFSSEDLFRNWEQICILFCKSIDWFLYIMGKFVVNPLTHGVHKKVTHT